MQSRKVGEIEMILIDMPMPENCFECPACNEYRMCAIPVTGKGWRESHVREYDQDRPNWCPLKEVIECKDCKYCNEEIIDRSARPENHYCADGA